MTLSGSCLFSSMPRQKNHAQREDHNFLIFAKSGAFAFSYFGEWLSYPGETNLHCARPWRLEPFYWHSGNTLIPQLMGYQLRWSCATNKLRTEIQALCLFQALIKVDEMHIKLLLTSNTVKDFKCPLE